MSKMCHYLLVYDHERGRLVRLDEFSNVRDATAAYGDAEREVQSNPQGEAYLEIVLVGADSIQTIMRTHATYFDGSVPTSKYLVGT